MVSWNSKAVGSAPDQTATFPEKSLIRLLAVVEGVVWSLWFYVCMFYVDPYECVATYDRLKLVGGLVICKMDLVH